MVIAKDIRNFSGELILSKGRPVSDKDIKTFKAWGILEIPVIGVSRKNESENSQENSVDPQLLKKAQIEVAKIFRHSNCKHPLMNELLQLSTQKKIKDISSGANLDGK